MLSDSGLCPKQDSRTPGQHIGEYVAWAVAYTNAVEVACLSELSVAPLRIAHENQEGEVTALTVGGATIGSSDPRPGAGYGRNKPSPVLFVATRSSVVAWRLQPLFTSDTHTVPSPPLQLISGQGHVDAMALCTETNRLVVCAGMVVHVFEMLHLTHALRLEGHRGPVLTAAFCSPHQPGWLVTAGEDRTYRLWDLDQGSLLYESPVLTAAPLLSLAVDPSYFRCAVGASDGVVRFFDLATLPMCRCLQVTDVAKQLGKAVQAAQAHAAALVAGAGQVGPRVIGARGSAMGLGALKQGGVGPSARPALVPSVASVPPGLEVELSTLAVGCSDAVLSLTYSLLKTGLADGPSGLLGESPRLLVGCMRGLVVLDTHSYQVLQVHFYAGSGVSLSAINSSITPLVTPDQVHLMALPEVEVPRAYAAALASHGQYMCACCTSASSTEVYIMTARPVPLPGASDALAAAQTALYGPGLSDGQYNNHNRQKSDTSDLHGVNPQQSSSSIEAGQPLLSVFPSALPLPNSPLMAGQEGGRESSSGSSTGGGGGVGGGQLDRPRSVQSASPMRSRQEGGGGVGGGNQQQNKWAQGAADSRPELQKRHSHGSNTGGGGGGGGGSGVKLPPVSSKASGGGGAGPKLQRSSSTPTPKPQGHKAGVLQDKPVTFHRQIKSSGYGYVHPQVKLGRPPPAPVKVNTRPTPVNQVAMQLLSARQYPLDGPPPVVLQEGSRGGGPQGRPHVGAVLGLKFSGDGSRLLTCSADKTARMIKLPMSKHQGEGTDLLGHNGAVVGVDWSQDSTMVLTASSDRTARLWLCGCAQPSIEFTHLHQTQKPQPGTPGAISSGSTSTPSLARQSSVPKSNPAYLHEVLAARFFYLDKFVLLATGNKLHMYTVKLYDGDPKDDLARLRNNNTYTWVTTWTGGAQAINTLSVVNTFHSPLVLTAASNRSIEVLDCNTMQLAATIPDAHTRPVQTIVQSAGVSMFTSHAREANELFATTATDGMCRLWDLRMCRCVRTFSGHKNTQIRVGAAFSPCLRFLACGSEDQAVHVYDLKQGTLMQRMRESHGDAVTDVTFNPLTPQLAAGNLAGAVHLYGL